MQCSQKPPIQYTVYQRNVTFKNICRMWGVVTHMYHDIFPHMKDRTYMYIKSTVEVYCNICLMHCIVNMHMCSGEKEKTKNN